MTEQNRALARRFVLETDNRQSPPEELMTPTFTAHMGSAPPIDLAGYKQFAKGFFAAIPDLIHDIEFIIAEDDKVAVVGTIRGTHGGELMGFAPTGNAVAIAGTAIFRIEGDKVAELWVVADQMGLMQQIGAMPAPAGT